MVWRLDVTERVLEAPSFQIKFDIPRTYPKEGDLIHIDRRGNSGEDRQIHAAS